MSKIIKVKCTGPGQHENEIDLETVLGADVIVSGTPIDTGKPVPERIVRLCEECDEGKVIIARQMLRDIL